MSKVDEFDYETYPDGISEVLNDIEHSVWDRGFYCETMDGVWYEMYVNEQIKNYIPIIEEDFENVESISSSFKGFHGLWLGNYEDNSQITFFVPNNEDKFTLSEMTDILI